MTIFNPKTHWGLIVATIVMSTTGWIPVAGASDGEDEPSEEEFTVVTTVERPRQSASESTMDSDEVQAIGSRSAQDLLRSMPGVQLSQHGSEGKAAQFFLRGFDASHGTDVTLNVGGLRLNEPSHIHGHGYADSGILIPEIVDRVVLRKGPFALDQGSLSTAGDIIFDLGVPVHLRGTAIGGEGGWPLRGRLWTYHAPPRGKRGDLVAAEVVADEGPFANRQTRRSGMIGQREFGDWKLRGALQTAEFGLPGAVPLADLEAGRIERGDTYTPDTTGQTGQIWLGGIYSNSTKDWGHRTSVDLRGRQFDARENFTGFLIDEDHGDERREFQRGASAVIDHRNERAIHSHWDLLGFAGVSVDRFRQFEDAIGLDEEVTGRTRGGQGWQGSVHVAPGLRGLPVEWFMIEGGVRLEGFFFAFQEDEEVGAREGREVVGVAAPRVKMAFYLGDFWTLFAAAGRGFRGPEARSVAAEESAPADRDLRFYRGGSAEITVVDAAEVGVSVEPSESLELTAALFGYWSGAEFIYDHVSRLNVDLGSTRRVGAEIAARLRIGSHMRFQGHVTVVDARFSETGGPIPFAPPVEAGFLAFGRWPSGILGGVQWQGVSSRSLPFGARAAPWSLFNSHIGWARAGWELRLQVDNLLGTSWQEGTYHFASRFDGDRPRSSLPSIHVVEGHPRMARLQLSYRW